MEKVTAYLTRERAGRTELLLFTVQDHPQYGTEVPGGGVDPGETLADALYRELLEEAGIPLDAVRLEDWLGDVRYEVKGNPVHRHFYHLTLVGDVPDRFDHVITGAGDDNGLLLHYSWCPLDEVPPLFHMLGHHLDTLHKKKTT